jgi:subtilisin
MMSTSRDEHELETTGRSVVVFNDGVRGDRAAAEQALRALAGLTTIVNTADVRAGSIDQDAALTAEAVSFETLDIAIVARDPAELQAALGRDGALGDAILAIEPERILHAIEAEPTDPVAQLADDSEFTWGLRATGVDATTATGSGIRVAILDTGFDVEHPDFAGRAITTRSFIPGEDVHDGHGHGTHTTGTACGSADPPSGRRYGVAAEAEIFSGKVLNSSGSGTDTGILAGIDWAITNACRIVSMSLGADIRQVSTTYEAVGQRALAAGTLIVAAAGNNASRETGNVGFVGVPANSPSIMAVAAVDSSLAIADFSAGASSVAGGEIDIAGPGVDVYSSWPMPEQTNTISGTSMATPHVAGIAALWAQTRDLSGKALWDAVVQAAKKLDLPVSDAGAGLVQAPAAAASPGSGVEG